ncbi:MAG: hypothetical protein OXG85_12185 [Chloroflexi bacterium]|nr:hypothetical protein [Chloroflexota bacterium]
MDQRSVFHEEWLRSLREQYKHVVRSRDRITLPSLTAVMQNAGFREAELAQLRIEATMHVDDVGANFAADPNILSSSAQTGAHPAECLCPQCAPVDESGFDAEGQPIAKDPDADEFEPGHVFPVADSSAIDEQAVEDPVTFADSVAAAEAQTDDADSDSPSDPDDGEADLDAPEQMSLF